MKVDSHQRSILKSIFWRIISILVTFFVSLIITHNTRFAISISLIDAVIKILAYYVHERLWVKVRWGRHRLED